MDAEQIFERHLHQLRRSAGEDLWRVLLAMVERQFHEVSAKTHREYLADPARAEAELIPMYRVIYLARSGSVGLSVALTNRRARQSGGDERARQKIEQGRETAKSIRAEAERLRKAGRAEKDLAGLIAKKLGLTAGHVRTVLHPKEKGEPKPANPRPR